jgi:ABC-type glycerol-3-phosphate transport system substrate-binding protein
VALASLVAAAAAGCNRATKDEAKKTSSAAPRTDVPLRVAMMGSEEEANAIRSAWNLAMPQPLEINLVDPIRAVADRSEGRDGATVALDEFASRSDILVFAQAMLGDLAKSNAIVDLNGQTTDQYESQYGRFYPSIGNGLGIYGGKRWAMPLGARVFALLVAGDDPRPETWRAYQELVVKYEGAAAEPTAAGWAASSFLNRCASTVRRGWLFSRSTMEALIDDPAYIDVLDRFAETAALYRTDADTPRKIWDAIRTGKLKAAIGFGMTDSGEMLESTAGESEVFDVTFFNPPQETDIDRLWFDVATPLAAVSSSCRQTAVSKKFIGWLSAGEGQSTVSNQIDGFSPTRISTDEQIGQRSPHGRWLEQRLQTRQAVTGLVIPGASRYYDALDQEVTACLSGERSAKQALQNARDRWESITESVGRREQTNAWRRAMGFGG